MSDPASVELINRGKSMLAMLAIGSIAAFLLFWVAADSTRRSACFGTDNYANRAQNMAFLGQILTGFMLAGAAATVIWISMKK